MVIIILLILSLCFVAKTEVGLPINQLVFVFFFFVTFYWFLLGIIAKRQSRILFTSLHKLIVVFIIYCLLNYFVAHQNGVLAERWLSSVRSFAPLLLIFPISFYAVTIKKINILLNAYITSAVVVSIYTLWIYLARPTNVGGMAGISASSHIWGLLLVSSILISKVKTSLIPKYFAAIIFCMHIYLEQRRTSVLLMSLGIFILYAVLFKFRKRNKIIKGATLRIVIQFILIFCVIAYVGYHSPRVNKVSLQRGVMGRYAITLAGLQEFNNSPLLGKGFGYQRQGDFFYGTFKVEPHTAIHNLYVNILFQSGVIGLLLFLLILLSMIKYIYSAIKKSRNFYEFETFASILIIFPCYSVFCFTSSRGNRPDIMLLLGLIAGVTVAYSKIVANCPIIEQGLCVKDSSSALLMNGNKKDFKTCSKQ